VVGDISNKFCIDPNHIAPISQLFTDMANNTLPAFSYIEPGYGLNDEHPGSGQSILTGQIEVAYILGQLMASPSWFDPASGTGSVFFLSYDEGGGPYEHVPPVPGYSNKNTNIANMGYLPGDSVYPPGGGSVYPGGTASPVNTIPDISTIAVNPDNAVGAAALYWPCWDNGTATLHCDLNSDDPGAHAGDAPAVQGFAAQLGFRLPNIVVSPFTRRHYVSHNPVDHTAVLKFVENRFIGPSAHLTYRDAAQSNFLDFFDFTGVPWATPPTGIPTPPQVLGTCNPTDF
jgi:phospholipase C